MWMYRNSRRGRGVGRRMGGSLDEGDGIVQVTSLGWLIRSVMGKGPLEIAENTRRK